MYIVLHICSIPLSQFLIQESISGLQELDNYLFIMKLHVWWSVNACVAHNFLFWLFSKSDFLHIIASPKLIVQFNISVIMAVILWGSASF